MEFKQNLTQQENDLVSTAISSGKYEDAQIGKDGFLYGKISKGHREGHFAPIGAAQSNKLIAITKDTILNPKKQRS